MLLTFNRTAPITEGWFSTYADMILSGKVPYRDFELVLPPLYTYLVAAVNLVFGNHLIVWRIIGMFLFIGTGTLAFKLFRMMFPSWVSAIARNSNVRTMGIAVPIVKSPISFQETGILLIKAEINTKHPKRNTNIISPDDCLKRKVIPHKMPM